MKDSTRAQAAITPMTSVIMVLVVAAVIIVGEGIIETMSAQLPSGEVVLCGGSCGSIFGMVSLVMAGMIGLVLLIVLSSGILGRMSR